MGVSNILQQQGATECHTCKKSDNIFSPIKNKMKVLKKIKKRMGLAPRSVTSCPGPNNLPPLQFHQVHGDNIRISREGTVAKRYESFCKGITFSARPVRVNERVCVKFLDISNNWSGVIRFGFTSNDPSMLRNNLPKYACPDLTNKPGFWAKALNERYCYRNNVLFYYVTSSGDVHFGINGEEKGVFITDVETRGPLWAVIDVYGNSTAIEFLDSRIYMFQQQQQAHSQPQSRRRSEHDLVPQLESLTINQQNQQLLEERPVTAVAVPASTIRHTANSGLAPLPFHTTKGRNVRLTPDRCIATRADTEFCQGYVFTQRPIRIGERIIIQILKTEDMYVGALALGLTSCDPATLQTTDLPDDSDLLLDRPEYWVVSKDVAATLVRGDEIKFCITINGEVQISKNGGPPAVVMHVDQSLQLWAFLDVYGSTQSCRIFTQPAPAPAPGSCAAAYNEQPIMPMPQVMPTNQRNLQVQIAEPSCRSSIRSDMIQIQPGGTVLVVNLPPTEVLSQQTSSSQQHLVPRGIASSSSSLSVPSAIASSVPSHHSSTSTIMSNYSTAYIEPIATNFTTNNAANWRASNDSNAIPTNSNTAIYSSTNCVDCTICYEKPIDSVLYMCGHMCMCYDCAIKQWRGIGGGHCPLCRAVIRDVIRTYKS